MTSNSGLLREMVWLIAGGALPLAAFGQNAPRVAPIPRDPLELATGQVQVAGTPASREAWQYFRLPLVHARNSYALAKAAGQAYDLRVGFTVDSLGQTNYDGSWQMEDLFSPGKGLRWTAKSAAGYTITGIASSGGNYGEGTASAVPLRLLRKRRVVLFDPIPSTAYAGRGSIRTATATFRGATLTCVLLSRSRNTANPAVGRGWEESEECIDPQSGLLQVHSEAPGRYAVYDYSNAPQLGSHVLPGLALR